MIIYLNTYQILFKLRSALINKVFFIVLTYARWSIFMFNNHSRRNSIFALNPTASIYRPIIPDYKEPNNTSKNCNTSCFNLIPDEVLLMIFSHLDGESLLKAALVCQHWYSSINHSTELWKKHIQTIAPTISCTDAKEWKEQFQRFYLFSKRSRSSLRQISHEIEIELIHLFFKLISDHDNHKNTIMRFFFLVNQERFRGKIANALRIVILKLNDINTPIFDDYYTLLYLFTACCNYEAVEFLINNGANPLLYCNYEHPLFAIGFIGEQIDFETHNLAEDLTKIIKLYYNKGVNLAVLSDTTDNSNIFYVFTDSKGNKQLVKKIINDLGINMKNFDPVADIPYSTYDIIERANKIPRLG